jgi:protein-S-isoprenylcysteine O-methyltransferase Ste14
LNRIQWKRIGGSAKIVIMFWQYFPLAHAIVFGLATVVLRAWLVGRSPFTFWGGNTPRDFAARWFYFWVPMADAAFLVWYAVTGNPGPPLLQSEALRWTGVVLMLVAPAWIVYSQAAMGSSWALGVIEKGELVTQGPFAVSRHPIYLGVRVTMTGQFLVIGSWPSFALWAASELLVQIQVRFEEEAMFARFGERYREYCGRVRRWL